MTVRVEVDEDFWPALRGAIPDRVRRDRFVARDLPRIKAVFREHWADGLLLPGPNPYYRTLFGNAYLGGHYEIVGWLNPDAVIMLRDVSVGEPLPESDVD